MTGEEDDERVNPEMVKGYNDGYLLEKHKPELVKELAEKVRSNEKLSLNNYSTGFEAGIDQAQRERFKENIKSKDRRRGR